MILQISYSMNFPYIIPLLILSLYLHLMTGEQILYCATHEDINQIERLQETLNMMNREEILELGRLLDQEDMQNNAQTRFGWQSLGIFIAGTITIIVLARYGNFIWDTLTGIVPDANSIVVDLAQASIKNNFIAMLYFLNMDLIQ